MLHFENAPKKSTNLSLSVATLEKARKLGMNLSKTVDELLEKEVLRACSVQRAERNKGSIESYNARIENEGTLTQQVNDWLIEQGKARAPQDVRTAA